MSNEPEISGDVRTRMSDRNAAIFCPARARSPAKITYPETTIQFRRVFAKSTSSSFVGLLKAANRDFEVAPHHYPRICRFDYTNRYTIGRRSVSDFKLDTSEAIVN